MMDIDDYIVYYGLVLSNFLQYVEIEKLPAIVSVICAIVYTIASTVHKLIQLRKTPKP